MTETVECQDQSRETRRSPRSDRGEVRTTGRDVEALTWLSQQWGAPLTQVGRLLRGPVPDDRQCLLSARATVARWRAAGWVDVRRVDTGRDRWVFPTAKTAGQMLGFPVKEWLPSVSKAGHMAAVNRVRLAACPVLSGWTSERVLLHEVGFRERGERVRVPDGVVADASGVRLLVEVELSAKAPAAAREMVSGWPRACRTWGSDGVWLVWGSDGVRAGVLRAVDDVVAEYDGGVGRDLREMTIRETQLCDVEGGTAWLR